MALEIFFFNLTKFTHLRIENLAHNNCTEVSWTLNTQNIYGCVLWILKQNPGDATVFIEPRVWLTLENAVHL